MSCSPTWRGALRTSAGATSFTSRCRDGFRLSTAWCHRRPGGFTLAMQQEHDAATKALDEAYAAPGVRGGDITPTGATAAPSLLD